MSTNNLGWILLKGCKSFHTKFWKWYHAVLKWAVSKLYFGIVVFFCLLVWVPLKLGYLLPYCCSTIENSMRPECLLMIFLLFIWLYLIVQLKIYLMILLKEPSIVKALLTLHSTTESYFFTLENLKNIIHCLVKMYVKRWPFLLNNIFIQVGTKLYRQVVVIPMGTNLLPWLPIHSWLLYERFNDVSFW